MRVRRLIRDITARACSVPLTRPPLHSYRGQAEASGGDAPGLNAGLRVWCPAPAAPSGIGSAGHSRRDGVLLDRATGPPLRRGAGVRGGAREPGGAAARRLAVLRRARVASMRRTRATGGMRAAAVRW